LLGGGIVGVHVGLDGEEEVVAAGVFVALWSVAWVPEVAGEFAVGGVEEGFELLFVLADEDDERRDAVVGEWGVAPPPAQEGVVAEELLV
jgi:hypothetical protein